MARVNLESDGVRANVLVLSAYSLRLADDLLPHFFKVKELLLAVSEVSMVLSVDQMVELENKRASGHNPAASRQEILPNDALKHRALARALAANDHYLGKVNFVL